MDPVLRSADGELCGYVRERLGQWEALTVFGGWLVSFSSRSAAVEHVLSNGMDSLAAHWYFRETVDSPWQIACIQEASPDTVRIAVDYYPGPGVPTVTLRAADVLTGSLLVLDPSCLPPS